MCRGVLHILQEENIFEMSTSDFHHLISKLNINLHDLFIPTQTSESRSLSGKLLLPLKTLEYENNPETI